MQIDGLQRGCKSGYTECSRPPVARSEIEQSVANDVSRVKGKHIELTADEIFSTEHRCEKSAAVHSEEEEARSFHKRNTVSYSSSSSFFLTEVYSSHFTITLLLHCVVFRKSGWPNSRYSVIIENTRTSE